MVGVRSLTSEGKPLVNGVFPSPAQEIDNVYRPMAE
jgi:hypothetical protein